MAGMSNYAEQQLLDWYYRGATWTGADPYIRLYSTNPTDFESNPPTGGTEMVGTGYTQYGQLAARGSTNWEVIASGNGMVGQNKQTAAFSWSNGSDWPAINGAALFDGNASGSNLIWGGVLTTPRDPSTGDIARFAAGAMQFKLDTTTLAGVSTESKTAMLQHLFIGDQSANRVPATAYLAVYTSATAINLMTGANGTEVSTSGTNYSRAAITSSTFWTAAAPSGTGYKITNASDVKSWSAAGTAWGVCRYVALVDTASGAIGHYYAIKQLTSDIQIDAGDTFSIAAGDLYISLDESN
jgi:hypothetical protein